MQLVHPPAASEDARGDHTVADLETAHVLTQRGDNTDGLVAMPIRSTPRDTAKL